MGELVCSSTVEVSAVLEILILVHIFRVVGEIDERDAALLAYILDGKIL